MAIFSVYLIDLDEIYRLVSKLAWPNIDLNEIGVMESFFNT
jgi:hypothetical protein